MNDFEIVEFDSDLVRNYEKNLKNMFIENTYQFHYPEKEFIMDFINDRYNKLRKYLNEKTTFFIAVIRNSEIVGFIWLYKSSFMNYYRLVINSFFVSENYRSRGIGKSLMKKAEEKALKEGCSEIATHYSTDNPNAGVFYLNNGFDKTRIEVVKKV